VKIGGLLLAGGAVFYGILALVYWFITGEIAGTTALTLTAGLAALAGFYLLFTAHRLGPLPEDNALANTEDADPDYGFFSPHSWWPLAVGFSTMIVLLGLVFAAWLVILGVGLLLGALVGFMFEYYRGPFADA
jgi:hypothetical protein